MINLHERMGQDWDRTRESDSHLLPDTLQTALRSPVPNPMNEINRGSCFIELVKRVGEKRQNVRLDEHFLIFS